MDARCVVTLEKYLKAGDKAVVYTHEGKFVAEVEFVGKYFIATGRIDSYTLYLFFRRNTTKRRITAHKIEIR